MDSAAEFLGSTVVFPCMIVGDGKAEEILADTKLLEEHGLRKP